MKHAVYFNLHKKCLSLRDESTRKVVGHCNQVWLGAAEFKVSEAGRQRVLREKRKNVHAVVKGHVLAFNSTSIPLKDHTFIYYNPYTTTGFVDSTGRVVKSAESVIVNGKSIFAKGIKYE
jgi:hypothetical protein